MISVRDHLLSKRLHKEFISSKLPHKSYATSIFLMPAQEIFFSNFNKAFKQHLWLAFFFLIAMPLVLGWIVKDHLKKQADLRVVEEGKRIEEEILTMVRETHEMMISIGKEISKDSANLYPIWFRLGEVFNHAESIKKSYTWPELAWIDTHMYQVVSTRLGVLDPPVDLSIRDYTKIASQRPWELRFAAPGPMLPIDEKGSILLPFGMGITDENGNFIGIVAGGFHREDIFKKINKTIRDKAIDFALIDHHDDAFVQTVGKNYKKSNQYASDDISPFISIQVVDLPGNPLTLVTYMDLAAFHQEYDRLFLPLLIKWIGGFLCIAILLYVFCYRVMKQNRQLEAVKKGLELATQLAASAGAEKEKFMRQIQSKLKDPFVIIVTYAEILLKYLKQEIDLELSQEKQIQFLNKIKKAIVNLEEIAKKQRV